MNNLANQRGTAIVFITLMVVLLMIMVGMGLDTGMLTYTRATGQSAVDAAALSAVSALPTRDPNLVQARALTFNGINTYTGSVQNPLDGADVSYVHYDFDANKITGYGAPITSANGVRVALEQGSAMATPAFLTTMLNLFGQSAPAVNHVSVSAVSVITSRPSIPIALWSKACEGSGIDVKIQMQHPDQSEDGNENSCWTTYLDCSSGAPDIKAGFETGGSCSGQALAGHIGIGTYICQNRGQVNTVLQTAEKFFEQYPNRWWIVPVIGGTGNCAAQNPTQIVNWAKIYPKEIVNNGNPKYLRADIVCDSNLQRSLEASLCFTQRLVREPDKGM